MKKLRNLLLILLSICMLGALAACGGSETYTVTFETYGGTAIEPYQLEEGDEIARPADPQKALFTFAGWYADEAYTQEFNFAQTMPANNLTVYARWTSQTSSRITYDSMGGTAVQPSVGIVGSRLTMPEAPTKEGYTFAGWYTTPTCNDNEYYSFTAYPEQSLTLYARWDNDPAYAYITYHGNDSAIIALIPVKKGTAIADPDLFPETGDLAYTGWYRDTALNNSYTFNETATGDLDLYTSYYTKGLVVTGTAVTGYTGTSATVIVPNIYNNNRISSVGEAAFRDHDGITQIDLPNAITSVGAQAFYRCRYLVSVNLTNRVTSIGNYAFFDCNRLTSYGDISNVTSIPEGLFLGCKKLSAVALSDSVTSVGAQAFGDCVLIKEMTLPAGVTAINNGLFDGCTSLEKVTFRGNLTTFGTNVFSGCSALSSVEISGNGNYSVNGRDLCHINTTRGTELVFHINGGETETDYSLPANINVVKAGAFDGNNTLKSVTVRASTLLERGAFEGMRALETLTAPALDSTNNYLAYYFGATSRETGVRRSAYIPATLRSVTFVGNFTAVGDSAFCGAVGLEEVSGLDAVTSIGRYAFAYTALKSFTVSPELTSIGEYAFTGCPKFEEYKTAGGASSEYSVYEGCLYNANGSKLLAVPSAKTQIEFKSGVSTIAAGAFTDSAVENVVVPDSVTSFELGAFSNSFALRSLSVPFIGGTETTNTYMAYIFGAQILYENDKAEDGTAYRSASILNGGGVPATLNELTVRKEYSSIPDNAFALFTGLTKVNFPTGNTVTSFGAYSFYNTDIAEIDLSHATKIGEFAFRQTSLTEVELPTTLTEFGVGAFAMISSLEGITIPEGITKIPAQAFCAYAAASNTGVGESVAYTSHINREIVIPASVTEIGSSAFEGVGMLHNGTTANVPNTRFSVTFKGATDGTSRLEKIGIKAFSYAGVRTLLIPASVTAVEKQAFSGCTALETIDFGSAERTSVLATLGELSFSGCTSLKTFTLYASKYVEMTLGTSDRNIFYDASEGYTVRIVATAAVVAQFQADAKWDLKTPEGDARVTYDTVTA